MLFLKKHPGLSIVVGAVLVLLLFAGGYGVWLANETNKLPWQEEPTRIVVEPFSGIPGFGDAAATPTP